MANINFTSRLNEKIPGNTVFSWKDLLYSNTAVEINATEDQYNVPENYAKSIQTLVEKILTPLNNAIPIGINSGYRGERANAAVGGVANNQHRRGEAADVRAKGGGKSNRDVFNYIKDNLPFDQMIWEDPKNKSTPPDGNPAWIHVSFNPNQPPRKQMLVYDGSSYKKYVDNSPSPPSTTAQTENAETKSDTDPAAAQDPQANKKDLKALFNEIEANQNAIEASDTEATWGKKSSDAETSDWISLKQFLLYLCTKYVPQTVLPFVELIPVVSVDAARDAQDVKQELNQYSFNYEKDGKTPETIKANYEKQPQQNIKMIEKLLKQIADPLPAGFDKNRFNLSAKTTNQQSGQTDLFNIDPWREGVANLTDLSASGKIVYAQRAIGMRVYSQLLLNAGPIAGVPSKPGPIGFKSVEINAGSQSDNGLAKISMQLIDVAGNKFTDINSPWAFIFDARPGSEGGDFYFRYGWELRLPKPGDKTDLISYNFWNHPGWGVFPDSVKTELQSQLQAPDYKIYLTHAMAQSDVVNQGQFYNSATTFNEETGEISVRQSLLEQPDGPFVRLSILNPELAVDSVTGAITATLSFMTTGAVVSMVPVVNAYNTKKLAAKKKVLTLAQLLVAFDSDCNQFGVLGVSNPAKRRFLKKVADRKGTNIKKLLNGEPMRDIAIILGADANSGHGAGNAEVDPNLVIIKISKSLNNDLNETNPNQTKTLIRWFRQVLEENDCVLLSTATGSGAGINSKYVITTTQNIDENAKNPSLKKGKAFNENKKEGVSLQSLLSNEHSVFSYRFAGSLVENIEVTKTDSTNSAAIAANFMLNNEATDEAEPQDNDTKGAVGPTATTAEDRRRNLLAIYAQLQNMDVSCIAHPWIGPGDYAFLKGKGFFDGRYQVLTVTHTLEGHKFTSKINAARILPVGAEEDKKGSKDHAVSNGKTNFGSQVTEQYGSKLETKNKTAEKAKRPGGAR